MLEVVNLKKIYKTKNGADVNALDGVSLKFPETGMVFLLGKSGSGKSTLLNVCGGLDSPTEGEIIVKGRSSKNFSQSDFDSYRNTFVGFIFQEYNILNEFSVEDNIALALELQGKNKDKAAINALLEQVDLQDMGKRKPNTLSGGQKQRIAIARALVKAPQIIMADEPTGALDSKTGQQVFETLKKLSRDKLVLVVSHDRDFAELYADRIIELKDGKVLSDVTKTLQHKTAITDNVNSIGDVLCVKGGASLTDADFAKIKAYLSSADRDVIIAGDQKDVQTFKKASRISDSGEKEVFAQTKEQPSKDYRPEDSRFIRSKLPARHALTIGVSGLRTKPIRLIFTVLLCTVAFTLFGLLSTLNFYNSRATFLQTMSDVGDSMMRLRKDYKATYTWYHYGVEEDSYENYGEAKFSPADLEEYSSGISPNAFGTLSYMPTLPVRQAGAPYWMTSLNGFAVLEEGNSLRNWIQGEYPTQKNQIVISSYVAQMLYTCKVMDGDGKEIELSSPESIIGKEFSMNGYTYTVTGIMDCGQIDPQYEVLKDSTNTDYNLRYRFMSYLEDGMYLLAFVTPEHLAEISRQNGEYTEGVHNYTYAEASMAYKGEFMSPNWGNANYLTADMAKKPTAAFYLNGQKDAPEAGEVFVSASLFCENVANILSQMQNEAWENGDEIDKEAADRYSVAIELAYDITRGGIYDYDAESKEESFTPYTIEQLNQKLEELCRYIKDWNISTTMRVTPFDNNQQMAIGEGKLLNVAAIRLFPDQQYSDNSVILSQEDFDALWNEQRGTLEYYTTITSDYVPSADAIYSSLYLPYTYNGNTAEFFWDLYQNQEFEADSSRTMLVGSFVNSLQMVDSFVQSASKIFLYVGLVMAVFAALLLSNFISVSISQKKKEIGILRAVGARGADVFKIFFSESFVISAICVVTSLIASNLICSMLNKEMAVGIGASVFVFGIPSILILIVVALLTAIVATFLPVNNAARKKPVDSIRAL